MISQLLISDNEKTIKDYIKTQILKEEDLFFEVVPENKQYLISQIREIIKNVSLSYPTRRVYLLKDFHLSSLEAQNSFLKILEEPPPKVLFILTTDNANHLISTVVSRTKIINLSKRQGLKIASPIKNLLEKVVSHKRLIFLGEKQLRTVNQEEAVSLAEKIVIFFKERLPFDDKAAVILKKTLQLRYLLEKNNLNPQLTIDNLLTFIWKIYMIN
jgi:DNA polymerase III delta prime subunit